MSIVIMRELASDLDGEFHRDRRRIGIERWRIERGVQGLCLRQRRHRLVGWCITGMGVIASLMDSTRRQDLQGTE